GKPQSLLPPQARAPRRPKTIPTQSSPRTRPISCKGRESVAAQDAGGHHLLVLVARETLQEQPVGAGVRRRAPGRYGRPPGRCGAVGQRAAVTVQSTHRAIAPDELDDISMVAGELAQSDVARVGNRSFEAVC